MASASEPSWSALLSGRNGIRSAALAGGVALHASSVYITITVLPNAVSELGGLDYYAWNTTLFVVTSVIGSTVTRSVTGRLGARTALLLALTIFAVGTVVCSAASSMPQMLVGRAVQGLGGGALLALSYSLVGLLFPPSLWPRCMALVSGMWGFATLGGPAIGGAFASTGDWRLAFTMLLPLVALIGLVVAREVPALRDNHPGNAVVIPHATLVLFIAAIGLISISSLGSTWQQQIAGTLIGLLVGALAIRIDSASAVRLLPQGAYCISSPIGSVFALMSLLSIVMACEIYLPYFLQVIQGLSPLVAGYMTASLAAGWTVASLMGSSARGAHVDRLILRGPMIVAVALATLAATLRNPAMAGTTFGLPLLTAQLVMVGYGIGIAWPHLLSTVLARVDASERDVAAASITTVQMFSTAFGAALAGAIANAAGIVDPGGSQGAMDAASYLFAALATAPLLAIPVAFKVASKGAQA